MPRQKFTDQDVQELSARFQRRYEAQFAWKSSCSVSQVIPGSRGSWPMSVISSGSAIDISDLENNLSPTNAPTFGYDGLAPYVQFDGINQTLVHIDAADFDIIGNEAYVINNGLTMGGWFYADASLITTQLMGKGAAGLAGCYGLQFLATGAVITALTNGAALEQVTSANVIADSTWFYAVVQWNPSTEHAVWLNRTKTTGGSALAVLQNNAVAFQIGAYNGVNLPFPGRASHCWLSCNFLSDAIIASIFEQQRALFGVQ